MLADNFIQLFIFVYIFLSYLQNPDAWALMGHVKYMTGDTEYAKDCYERTISFLHDASEMHSIYLRLASIYLQDKRVNICSLIYSIDENNFLLFFMDFFLLHNFIFYQFKPIRIWVYGV